MQVMNEQELQARFGHPDFGLDGVWSKQTKRLAELLGACQIELDKWWAMTPQNWQCPCCERHKHVIVVLGSNNTLIAKLESHHDHIGESVDDFLTTFLKMPKEEVVRLPVRNHVKLLARNVLARFNPTITCAKCNGEESKLKSKFNLDRGVTLAPNEMKLLRGVQADSSVSIDMAARLKAFKTAREALIVQAVENFNSDDYAQNTSHMYWDRTVKQHVSAMVERVGNEESTITHTLDDFLSASTSNPNRPSSREEDLPQPTLEQYRAYRHPQPIRQESWEAIDENWACPICKRCKFECFRSSPKAKRKFNGNFYPKSSSQLFAEGDAKFFICQDCNDFPLVFRKYLTVENRPDFIEPFEFLFLDALFVRANIDVSPHQRHRYHCNRALTQLDEHAALAASEVEL